MAISSVRSAGTRRAGFVLLALIAVLLIWPNAGLALERTALVVGNGAYQDAPLKNPVNDALDVAQTLKALGFQVIHVRNAGQREFEKAVRQFKKDLQKRGGVGLFFYAGHGIQVQGRNYLIPVDADIQTEADVKYKAVDTGLILDYMDEADAALNIVILDACRDNPYARRFRSATRGLARLDMPVGELGSLLAYSTAPGQVAADGTGRNSPFTKYLLQTLKTPDLRLLDVFQRVRIAVYKETHGKQIPWVSESLLGDFYFRESTNKVSTPTDFALTVRTDPDDAHVRILDIERSYQPGIRLKPGRYHVQVSKKGHEKQQQWVNIKDADRTVTITLRALSKRASLTIRSNVYDDRVYIDGALKGSTRLDLNLEPGRHTVRVEKVGYETFEERIELASGAHRVVRATLKRRAGIPTETELPEGLGPKHTRPGARMEHGAPAPGTVWTEPHTGMEFIWIPEGCIERIGPPSMELVGEPGREPLCVEGLWFAALEVTNRQYRLFRPGHNSGDFKGHSLNGDEQPVVHVSWIDAATYAEWLSVKSGQALRLPTEDEWEYAARAGVQSARYWGDDPSEVCRYANGYDRSAYRAFRFDWPPLECDDGFVVSAPIERFRPNRFGLFDMLGNVWEWTWPEGQGPYPQGHGSCPNIQGGDQRVFRGGAWSSPSEDIRATSRLCESANHRDHSIGFRLVRAR